MPNQAFATVVAVFALPSCVPCPPCPSCPKCPPVAEPVEAEKQPRDWYVIHVTDGDTLMARLEGAKIERKETIRLLNVDTPEKDEPGFVEAKEALKYLVRGAHIRLEFEKANAEDRDGFGRLLAYVYVDEQNVNVELVRQGWSEFYAKYGRGRFANDFEAAEKEAKADGRGLWFIKWKEREETNENDDVGSTTSRRSAPGGLWG